MGVYPSYRVRQLRLDLRTRGLIIQETPRREHLYRILSTEEQRYSLHL